MTSALPSQLAGSGRTRPVSDTEAAHDLLRSLLLAGDVALFKSSRDAGLRWLGDRLAGAGDDRTAPDHPSDDGNSHA